MIFLSFFETDSGSCCRGIWQNMWAIHMLLFTKYYRRQTSYLKAYPYPLGYHAQGSTVSSTAQTHWPLDLLPAPYRDGPCLWGQITDVKVVMCFSISLALFFKNLLFLPSTNKQGLLFLHNPHITQWPLALRVKGSLCWDNLATLRDLVSFPQATSGLFL